MAYHVTKDLKAEVKVSGSLFLKDLLILVLYPTIMWFFTGGLVADTLKIPYIIYNVLVILVLLQRPASNPGKQVWQVCVFLLTEDLQTYHMIRPVGEKDVDLDKIKEAGLNTITPVLICNTDDYEKISLQKEGDVLLDEAVLKIS